MDAERSLHLITAKQNCLPVTALEFLSFGGSELLLAGEGPYLKLFSTEGHLLIREEVLPFKRIHGIRPAPDLGCQPGRVMLVFGQKGIRIVQLLKENSKLRVAQLTTIIEAPDWILDACLLDFADLASFSLCYITAHNAVTIHRQEAGVTNTSTVHCETNCILYAARLVTGCPLTVLCGTVFNHILLWTVDTDMTFDPSVRAPVRLSLLGHEGVIFSLRLSDDECQLVSVSDDRTVRVWPLPSDWSSHLRAEVRGGAQTLYGHSARVWDARLLRAGRVVSVGEDATCHVWKVESGQCVHVVEGHKGRSVWSMAVDSGQMRVATGGGDCSIRLFCLGTTEEMRADSKLPTVGKDFPRSVCLHGNTALCHTDTGVLYAAEWCVMNGPPVWREVHRDHTFSSYCSVALCSQGIALGNLHGYLKLLQLDQKGCVCAQYRWEAHSGKVFSLNWYQDLLFSSGPRGLVRCWKCQLTDPLVVLPVMMLELPYSKHRWVVAVLTTRIADSADDILILGDRRGSLHVYRTQLGANKEATPLTVETTHPIQPLASLRVHGPNGVTSIKLHRGQVYSTGRDGYCRRFSINYDGTLTELNKFKPVPGMDWLEEVFLLEDDTLAIGFHMTDLVLYSCSQNKHLARINCGGGHRSYGIAIMEQILKAKIFNVVYIKQSALCFRAVSLESYFTRPVIQPGFVGREAISLEILEGDYETGSVLLALGSEDTSVTLLSATPHSRPVVLTTLTGHLSSVRALSSSPCPNGLLLFSGGARASLKAWSIPLGSPECLCETVVLRGELFLHNKPLWQQRKSAQDTVQPECRVMSLAACPLSEGRHYLAAACSDGVIRQIMFDETTNQFLRLSSLYSHTHCILSIKLLSVKPELTLLLSAATDGTVCMWGFELKHLNHQSSTTVSDEGTTKPILVFKAHQSGINDLIASYQDGLLTVVTVGDDNALSVSRLVVEASPQLTVTLDQQHTQPSAHSSSITGVDWVCDDLVVTTSVDQRLSLWTIDPLTLRSSFIHDVADPAALSTFSTRNGISVIFCGVGLQYYQLQAISHK